MSDLPADYLDDAWRDLGRRNTGTKWAAVRLPESAVERELLLALDENNVRHLLVPAGSGRYSTNTRSPLSIDVGEHRFKFDDGEEVEGRYLDVFCRVPKLNDQFDRVVEDVLESIETAPDPARRTVTTVTSWRRLFSTMASAKALSLNEKYAIFAELLVLDQLALYMEEFSADWWTGPRGDRHDFELPDLSIEVKAIGVSSRTISIHGIHQLSETNGNPLHLAVVGLEESPDGLTVHGLLESIADRSIDGEKIRLKAAALGVFEDPEDTVKLQVTKIGLVTVDEEFPRLIVDDLPPLLVDALDGIQYDLLLSEIQPRLEFIELKELVNELEN